MPPINPTSLTSIRDLSSLLAFLRNPDPLSGLGWMIRDDENAGENFTIEVGVGLTLGGK